MRGSRIRVRRVRRDAYAPDVCASGPDLTNAVAQTCLTAARLRHPRSVDNLGVKEEEQ
ncbi:MAG: hypothetical protein ABSF46_00655 [Terriglobia bacterium]|jgi:hypothetical protein